MSCGTVSCNVVLATAAGGAPLPGTCKQVTNPPTLAGTEKQMVTKHVLTLEPFAACLVAQCPARVVLAAVQAVQTATQCTDTCHHSNQKGRLKTFQTIAAIFGQILKQQLTLEPFAACPGAQYPARLCWQLQQAVHHCLAHAHAPAAAPPSATAPTLLQEHHRL